jgi:hypothetical protein
MQLERGLEADGESQFLKDVPGMNMPFATSFDSTAAAAAAAVQIEQTRQQHKQVHTHHDYAQQCDAALFFLLIAVQWCCHAISDAFAFVVTPQRCCTCCASSNTLSATAAAVPAAVTDNAVVHLASLY